jgi:hypothetical protein
VDIRSRIMTKNTFVGIEINDINTCPISA